MIQQFAPRGSGSPVHAKQYGYRFSDEPGADPECTWDLP